MNSDNSICIGCEEIISIRILKLAFSGELQNGIGLAKLDDDISVGYELIVSLNIHSYSFAVYFTFWDVPSREKIGIIVDAYFQTALCYWPA